MDHQIASIIEDERANLVSEDRVALRDTIARIESRVVPEESSEQALNGSANQALVLNLIRVGIELQNPDLLLILVAKLKLGQVALVLQSQLSKDKSKLFAISYVAEHFHIDYPVVQQQLSSLNSSDRDTIFKLKSVVKLFIESNEWKKASEYSRDSGQGQLLNRLICLKLAQHYEATENFYEALVNYETSGTHLENSLRVIIKQFLESSCSKLREYCQTNALLNSFWNQFSLFCFGQSSGEEMLTVEQCTDDMQSQYRSGLLAIIPRLTGEELISLLPDRMKKFVDNCNDSKTWLNRRIIEGVMASSASLDPSIRRRLLVEASRHQQSHTVHKACALFLCLGESMLVCQLSSRFLNESDSSQLNFLLNLPEASTVYLLQVLRSQSKTTRSKDQLNALKRDSLWKRRQLSVFFSNLNLGLLDETMKCYCDTCMTNEDSTRQILDNLEDLVANRHSGALERIDPTIRVATLSLLQHNLASERIPITAVISIIIYCMAIYTYKLECSDFVSIPIGVLQKLERMFEQTSDWMKGYIFNATNSLVRSTGLLVTAIKEKLEIVSDSEIIRAGIKSLVESVASRCLVESQFKQAATLYSQIEDQVSAVKALMRSGDIDTVMNYSLLARDITVERLTINYLKHLDVDSTIIEEFIAKSKQQ